MVASSLFPKRDRKRTNANVEAAPTSRPRMRVPKAIPTRAPEGKNTERKINLTTGYGKMLTIKVTVARSIKLKT